MQSYTPNCPFAGSMTNVSMSGIPQQNTSDGFTLPTTTIPLSCRHQQLDPTTDPNDARAGRTYGRTKNYSRYELDCRPDDALRFMVQGTRNPVDCQLSQPFISYSKNDQIDYMSTCGTPSYNRNGRFVGNIYKNNE